MNPGFDQDDTKGLPLFAGIADQCGGLGVVDSEPATTTSFDALAKKYEDVEFSPDPIREVIKATPLTIEQADALRRGETLAIAGPEDSLASPRREFEKPFRLIDGKVRGSVEEPRLSAQCRAILAKLKEGPATNKELAAISLKYTGRISDLRQSGIEVDVASRDRKTGVTVYKLREKP
jgi:hypothetical protein